MSFFACPHCQCSIDSDDVVGEWIECPGCRREVSPSPAAKRKKPRRPIPVEYEEEEGCVGAEVQRPSRFHVAWAIVALLFSAAFLFGVVIVVSAVRSNRAIQTPGSVEPVATYLGKPLKTAPVAKADPAQLKQLSQDAEDVRKRCRTRLELEKDRYVANYLKNYFMGRVQEEKQLQQRFAEQFLLMGEPEQIALVMILREINARQKLNANEWETVNQHTDFFNAPLIRASRIDPQYKEWGKVVREWDREQEGKHAEALADYEGQAANSADAVVQIYLAARGERSKEESLKTALVAIKTEAGMLKLTEHIVPPEKKKLPSDG